jgi:phage shock protein C
LESEDPDMPRKLYRSQTNRIIAGVCGGLGEYLSIDPVFIRLFFVLLVLGQGAGVLVYLILWFALPSHEVADAGGTTGAHIQRGASEFAERAREMGNELRESATTPNPQARLFAGLILVLVGLVYLLKNLNVFWLQWLNFSILWPFLLIVGGLAVLLRGLRREL